MQLVTFLKNSNTNHVQRDISVWCLVFLEVLQKIKHSQLLLYVRKSDKAMFVTQQSNIKF